MNAARRHTPAQRLIRRVSRTMGAWRATARPGLRVLLYHAVGSDVPGDTYGMSVAPSAFADQMRWLREETGYTITSLDAGVNAPLEQRLAATSVAITFDDAFADVLTEAAPVLARYDIPFTVFAVGSYVTRPPVGGAYLDAAALRELAAVPGATIGAHGFTHRPLTRLDRASLDDELRRSREVLADCTGRAATAIAYPHGAVNDEVVARVNAAGYAVGATSFAGINAAAVDRRRLRRTEILAGDGLREFGGKLRGDYDWYHLRQRLYWPLPDGR